MIIWLTGQPGSGKSTLANELCKHFENSINIDGDGLREIFNNFNYTKEGRIENINNVIVIAKFLHSKNMNVIISVVGPYKNLRDKLKIECNMIELYVHTDNKRGREKNFCKEYEKPIENYIDVNTTNISVEETINNILEKINNIINE